MKNDNYIGTLDGGLNEIKEMDMELCKILYGDKWKEHFEELYKPKQIVDVSK